VYSYDALASYAFKAKIFFLNQGIPTGFFNWNEIEVTHPDYPLMLPFLMTWVYMFTGFNDLVVTKIMPITLVFFILFFYSQLKSLFNRTYALSGIFIICTVTQIVNYVTIIHADFFLLSYVTCAFLLFLRYLRNLDRESLIAASILFALSIWLKNEGIIFLISFMACLVVFSFVGSKEKVKRLRQNLGMAVLICCLIVGPWYWLKIAKHMTNSDMNLSMLNWPRFTHNIKDFYYVFNEFQENVFQPKKWNIFWEGIFLTMILMRRRLFDNKNFYISLFLMIAVAGYLLSYTLFTGLTIEAYANTTMSRFMIHLSGLSLLLSMSLLWEKVKS